MERLANGFVRFPCNVGDTVFTTYSNKVEVEEVIEIRIYKNELEKKKNERNDKQRKANSSRTFL